MSRYAPQTYDAVWAIALALRGAELGWLNHSIPSTLDNFDYSRFDMSKEFKRQFEQLEFLGVSVSLASHEVEHIIIFINPTGSSVV